MRSPKKTARGVKSNLESNLIPTRDAWGVQTKPYAYQDPGKGAVTPQETEPDLPVSA